MARKDLHGALNAHLSKEMYAFYLYLSMASYFEAANYPGFASWMKAQAREEYEHAMRFWDYIYDRGGRVTLLGLDRPPSEFRSPLDAFEQALKHERRVTKEVHGLYERAVSDKDHATQVFLNWFVQEQVEEEKQALNIVDTLKMVDDSPAGILMLDRELGARGTDGSP